jgi:hypothetical protein
LERSSKFLANESFESGDQIYTGLPLSDEAKSFSMRIYPSVQMEEHFTTNDPLVYTIVTVLAFAFTSALFLVYDRCVEKRQQKVMHTAVKSTENVALLEEMVQERTRKLEESNAKLEAASVAQLEVCDDHTLLVAPTAFAPLLTLTIFFALRFSHLAFCGHVA